MRQASPRTHARATPARNAHEVELALDTGALRRIVPVDKLTTQIALDVVTLVVTLALTLCRQNVDVISHRLGNFRAHGTKHAQARDGGDTSLATGFGAVEVKRGKHRDARAQQGGCG